MHAMTKALLVMLLDEKIRTFLSDNDPKALEQALCACKLVDDIPRETHLKLNKIADEHGERKKARTAKRTAKKGPEPIIDECDECQGEGEVQQICDQCRVPLTTANWRAENEEYICNKCVEEENG